MEKRLHRESHPSARQLQQYVNDPVAFAYDCFDWPEGGKLADYQEEAMYDLIEFHRYAGRGPHGIGKDAILALLGIWFYAINDGENDWKNLTTAGAWNQLKNYLWPEYHKWVKRARQDKLPPLRLGKELLDLAIKGETGLAFAISSQYDDKTESTKGEGAHADQIMTQINEAKIVPEGIWDATEGALSTGTRTLAIALSTPGAPSGRFHKLFVQREKYKHWKVRHVTKEEAIAAGRMNPEWAENMARQWGVTSSMYLNRVEGEFASGEDDCVPLAWVEQAQHRWEDLERRGKLREQPFIGVSADIADSGADRTCIGRRYGSVICDVEFGAGVVRDDEGKPAYGLESVAAAGRIKNILEGFGGLAVVDANTVGATVIQLVREDFTPSKVLPYNGMIPTTWKDDTGLLKFRNTRSAAYWNLRSLLDPRHNSEVALPPDDALTEDLTTPKWLPENSQGQIALEPKEHLISRLGRSPDEGDMVAMAFWIEQLRSRHGSSIASPAGRLLMGVRSR